MIIKFTIVTFLVGSAAAATAQPLSSDTFLISRGDASLTTKDFDARMSRMTSSEQADLARQPQRLSAMMDTLLLNRQLAQEARELNLDKDQNVQMDIQLAIEEVLATHRLTHEANKQSSDYEQLAREMYDANPSKYAQAGYREVQHILVKTDARSDDEAKQLALAARTQAMIPGADFENLVLRISEDPGKTSNKGIYRLTRQGEYVPEFEEAANALVHPGEITDLVKTKFGYHIIKLNGISAARTPAFEEVKDSIVVQLLGKGGEESRNTLRAIKRQEEEKSDTNALRQLPNRYGANIKLPDGNNSTKP